LGGADFVASASAIGGASGHAIASNLVAMQRVAQASGGGDAMVSLANSGELSVIALANADAGTHASAIALIQAPEIQRATAAGGGNASVSLTNAATMAFNAAANANGSQAFASGHELGGINLYATA